MQHGRAGFNPWVGKIPWRREQLPTPVFLPGEFHGQRVPDEFGSDDNAFSNILYLFGHSNCVEENIFPSHLRIPLKGYYKEIFIMLISYFPFQMSNQSNVLYMQI